MTSHASRKTKHSPPRLRNPLLIMTLPTVALHQPSPSPSPGPENSSTHKMRATREKSHIVSWEGLHLEKPEGLGPQVSPSHLAKPSWKEDRLCARASPECREEMSLNVPSRGNCTPKGVASPQIGLLDSNTNTTKSQPTALLPTEREKTCTRLGSLGT